MEPDRLQLVAPDCFLHDYVAECRPCIIVDGMQGWKASQLWSVEYFAKEFGGELVQVYNDGFDLITVCKLSEYLDKYFFSSKPMEPVPYVRWYTKLKDVDFFWSD